MPQIFSFMQYFDDCLWGYLGFPAIILTGIFLSIQSRFVQIRKFPYIIKTFLSLLIHKNTNPDGIHPLKAFFACVGGCVGLGNIVGICTAVQIGGPGALFWIWITAILGMVIKYAEVFLGLKYRVSNGKGGYNGGPMYFLQKVYKAKWVPKFVCFLLCIYGVEVYQFRIVTTSLTQNLNVNEYAIIGFLLAFVIYSCSGGIRRVGTISGVMIPVFVVMYVGMGFWVLVQHAHAIPAVLNAVFVSAFSEHAAVGGFAGSTILLTISQGIRRGCYTGDVGIGYASVIHSESAIQTPEKQASLVIFDIFLDTLVICSTSLMIILVTETWLVPMDTSFMVQSALAHYFPFVNFFMPFFVFLVGVSTINIYFCVGLKCAEYLSPRFGKKCFYLYAIVSLIFFSFVGTAHAQTFMSVTGGLLLLINLYGIVKLRHEISYEIEEEPVYETSPSPS